MGAQRGFGQSGYQWGGDKDGDDPMYALIDKFYKETGFLAEEETPNWGLLLVLAFITPFAAFALIMAVA